MNEITEDYVSYEVAKLLKEKGFTEECEYFYDWYKESESYHICSNGGTCNNEKYPDEYSMPTHQMAMKWLRRIHNVNIDIVSIWNQKRFEYQVFVVTPKNAKHCYVDNKLYLGYEEAVEAGLKYALKNLI